jgi:hypothetical protein|nr:MAG TPA: hypothetical protein [Caudoviricetes sp.]
MTSYDNVLAFRNYVAYVTSHRAVVKRKKRGKR